MAFILEVSSRQAMPPPISQMLADGFDASGVLTALISASISEPSGFSIARYLPTLFMARRVGPSRS